MAAMGIRGLVESDGRWGERACAYYTARAAGGVGAFLFPEWWKTDLLPAEMMPVSASVNPNHYLPANPRFNTRALTTEEAAAHAQAFGYAAARARDGGTDSGNTSSLCPQHEHVLLLG